MLDVLKQKLGDAWSSLDTDIRHRSQYVKDKIEEIRKQSMSVFGFEMEDAMGYFEALEIFLSNLICDKTSASACQTADEYNLILAPLSDLVLRRYKTDGGAYIMYSEEKQCSTMVSYDALPEKL